MDDVGRLQKYTAGAWFSETTAAKDNIACLQVTVEHLARKSLILQRAGQLAKC